MENKYKIIIVIATIVFILFIIFKINSKNKESAEPNIVNNYIEENSGIDEYIVYDEEGNEITRVEDKENAYIYEINSDYNPRFEAVDETYKLEERQNEN